MNRVSRVLEYAASVTSKKMAGQFGVVTASVVVTVSTEVRVYSLATSEMM